MEMDERSIQLARDLRQSAPGTSEYQRNLHNLAEAILQRSDKLYLRSLKSGRAVYALLYQQLHNQLMELLESAIAKLSENLSDRQLEIALDDWLFKAMAITAKQHPCKSLLRQLALSLLMEAILSSGRLQHPQKGSFALPQSLYKDVRNEALQQALLEVCQKIQQYDPGHEVMAWVNFLLDRRFIDTCRKYCRQGITQVPRDTRVELQHTQTQEDFDKVTSNSLDCDSELADLIELVEEDSEGIFSREHIRKRPDVTFQAIFLAKFQQDRTWEEITESFGISSISTVHTFFGRCLKKLRPYFQKYL